MITKFGTLYAGHVDMGETGMAGTPVNDRSLSNERLISVFDKAAAIADLMDRTDFDTFWLAEHHFQREGYECIPNILMLAVHLAQRTKTSKSGCGSNITPMWPPLRLAEHHATAHTLTDGGAGCALTGDAHTREVGA